MAAGPIAEESELLFFNAVFHLPSSTVNLVVDRLCVPEQIGDYKARVGSLGRMLGFGNNASLLIPTAGPILEAFEESDFLAAFISRAYVNQFGAISISFSGCVARSSSNVISFCGTDLSACEASRQRSQPDVSLSFST